MSEPVAPPPDAASGSERPRGDAGTRAATCSTCGSPQLDRSAQPFVYALGRIEPRFPKLSVEKEFAQALGREDTRGLSDRQALSSILSKREYRYLARQLCWVFAIEGLETYLLLPRDPADLDLLVGSLRPTPGPLDIDVVIGLQGPVAPPDMCNGLTVPIVGFDHLYSFDRDSLLAAVPLPAKMKNNPEQFRVSAGELLDRMLQLADNAGATPQDRALNYLALRYPAIYEKMADELAANASLSAVEVRPSPLASTRHVVDVVFSFRNRQTDVVDKAFVRVDVTEEFPFLVTKLSPYYDR
jgi:hypothetical protein